MMDVSEKIREFRQKSILIYRELAEKRRHKTLIVVHLGICGASVGAREIYEQFIGLVEKANLQEKVIVEVSGCPGLCSEEPLVQVIRPGQPRAVYRLVDSEKAEAIFCQHVLQGIVIHPWLLSTTLERR